MSFEEGALMIGLIVLVFGGGYGLFLKYQIDHDTGEDESQLNAPPAE